MRKMRPSSIVMLAVALVLGISAALLSKVWLQAQVPQPQLAEAAPKVNMGTIVTAAKALRFGNRISSPSGMALAGHSTSRRERSGKSPTL